MAQLCPLLSVLALLLVGLGEALSDKPHIVFIFADDLGWADIGYHDSRIETPTLDMMSEDGVRLENMYAQPVCSASRTQFLSGRYQIHEGLQHYAFLSDQPIGLTLDVRTLGDVLRDAGYATHQVGKWHQGFFNETYMPHNRGFDTAFGYMGAAEGHYDHKDDYQDVGYFLDLRLNGEVAYGYDGLYSTHMYTDYVIDLIEAHDPSQPLFLYLSYQAPHFPMEVPKPYEDLYTDITDDDRRIYAGMVTALDEGVANVTAALKANGLWDDTLFIFSSDNGGSSNAGSGGYNWPFRGVKNTLWEGGMRVPAFVTGGASIDIDRGSVNNNLYHITDWFPTLTGRAGASLNGTKPLDGFDIWESISTGSPSPRTMILHNIDTMEEPKGISVYPSIFDTTVCSALRVGDLKILTGDPGRGNWVPPPEMTGLETESLDEGRMKNIWLFNITADPEERIDLSETRPDLVEMMLGVLAELNAEALPPYYPDQDPAADPRLHNDVWSPWM